MDTLYLLNLLKEADKILKTINPGFEQAFEMGRAEGCIQCAIIHLEAQKEAA